MPSSEVRIWAVERMPEIKPGENLCATILAALRQTSSTRAYNRQARSSDALLEPGSILVVAQKVVSKAEGRLVDLETVTPSVQAREWAGRHDKDPRMVEVVLRETKRVVRMDRGVLISETHHGFVCANAGVDASNAPKGTVVLLPEDPDRSARELRLDLEEALRLELAVIISDTFGRPWRQGLTNVALGVAGLAPLIDYRGKVDFSGRPLRTTVLAVADELAAAAELVMGKTLGIPVVVIEGFQYQPGAGSGRELIRSHEDDLFR